MGFSLRVSRRWSDHHVFFCLLLVLVVSRRTLCAGLPLVRGVAAPAVAHSLAGVLPGVAGAGRLRHRHAAPQPSAPPPPGRDVGAPVHAHGAGAARRDEERSGGVPQHPCLQRGDGRVSRPRMVSGAYVAVSSLGGLVGVAEQIVRGNPTFDGRKPFGRGGGGGGGGGRDGRDHVYPSSLSPDDRVFLYAASGIHPPVTGGRFFEASGVARGSLGSYGGLWPVARTRLGRHLPRGVRSTRLLR